MASLNLRKYYKILRPLYVPLVKFISNPTGYERKRRIKTKGNKLPDKKFYIIRRTDSKTTGLFSNYVYVLRHIDYARRKGFIPVVDFRDYANAYLEDSEIGEINSWEYFFEQPCGYTLDDIKNAKNVWLSNGSYVHSKTPIGNDKDFFLNKDAIIYWRNRAQDFIKLNKDANEKIEKEAEKIFAGKKNILGVHSRGGYSGKVSGELMRQPSIEALIDKVKEFHNKYRPDMIYFASDEGAIKQRLKEEFGDILVFRESVTYNYFIETDEMVPNNGETSKYNEGLQYLIDMALLSKCDEVIMGPTFGAVGVNLLSKGFKDSCFFDMGKYKDKV